MENEMIEIIKKLYELGDVNGIQYLNYYKKKDINKVSINLDSMDKELKKKIIEWMFLNYKNTFNDVLLYIDLRINTFMIVDDFNKKDICLN